MTDSQERIFARSVYRHNHAVYAVAHGRQLSRHLRVMTGHTAYHQRRRELMKRRSVLIAYAIGALIWGAIIGGIYTYLR